MKLRTRLPQRLGFERTFIPIYPPFQEMYDDALYLNPSTVALSIFFSLVGGDMMNKAPL